MNMATLSDNIRHLASLKTEKRRLAELTKENNAQLEQVITVAMLDMADAAGLSSVDDFSVVVDGRRYSITTKSYYSIPDERRDEGSVQSAACGGFGRLDRSTRG